MEPSSSESQNKDVLSFLFKAGRKLAAIFKGGDAEKSAEPEKPVTKVAADHPADSLLSQGVVYANALAYPEVKKQSPSFPAGSILVRERHDTGIDNIPEAIIAMVKRVSSFSDRTNDWEFLVLSKNDLKLRSRETTGSCAICHVRAQKTDWVFLEYLK